MPVTHTYIPYNPNFNMEEYLEYRKHIEAYGTFIWTSESMDHMRLPGNINIIDLMIYNGMVFQNWLGTINYRGENILYSPAFPDIIYSINEGTKISGDSPHVKIPPSIVYKISRREPASMAKTPFGSSNKQWKFRKCGEFKGPDNQIYRIRYRFWESSIDFICAHRSGAEAEALCIAFEQYMDMNEGKLLEAGLNKMAPLGRSREPIVTLEESRLQYRITRFWFRTQEFQFAGPITPISDVHINVDTQEDVIY